MAADDLAMQGARASTAMVLTYVSEGLKWSSLLLSWSLLFSRQLNTPPPRPPPHSPPPQHHHPHHSHPSWTKKMWWREITWMNVKLCICGSGSWRCDCFVTWFCYQLIAKTGNKAATPPGPDPYAPMCPFISGNDTHYNEVIMSAMASQITSLTIVYSTVHSRCRSRKTSKLRVTGLCEGNSLGTGEFPTQRASNGRFFHLMTSSWLYGKLMYSASSNMQWGFDYLQH